MPHGLRATADGNPGGGIQPGGRPTGSASSAESQLPGVKDPLLEPELSKDKNTWKGQKDGNGKDGKDNSKGKGGDKKELTQVMVWSRTLRPKFWQAQAPVQRCSQDAFEGSV